MTPLARSQPICTLLRSVAKRNADGPAPGEDAHGGAGGQDGGVGRGLGQEVPLGAVDGFPVEVQLEGADGVDVPGRVVDLVAEGAAPADAEAPAVPLEVVFVAVLGRA